MKRTKSINLTGQSFLIDEDALQRLETYLQQVENTLRAHVAESETDSTEEVMRDIEARIAELFCENLSRTHLQVVEMSLVEAVMTQLGSPQSYVTGEETTAGNSSDGVGADMPQDKGPKRRLYRDEEDQILGGVCSGVAAMLGWDPVWTRLLMIGLTILTKGVMSVIYLFMWIVMPAAKTAAQRLEMRGEVASIDNIQREVERMKQNVNQRSLRQVIGSIFRVIAKILLVLVIIALIVPLLAILIAGIAMLVGGTSILATIPLFSDFIVFAGHPWWAAGYCFTLFFVLGIPLFAVLYWVIKYVRTRKHPSVGFWALTTIGWIAAVMVCFVMSITPFI